MGTMGLALPWETRIASVPREREKRVEPSEYLLVARRADFAAAATAATSEDAEARGTLPAGELTRLRTSLCAARRAHEERRPQFAWAIRPTRKTRYRKHF